MKALAYPYDMCQLEFHMSSSVVSDSEEMLFSNLSFLA